MLELTDIHMPHMGSVEFALLTEWLIKPGEEVNEGDALCEVSTDKVDTEVESPESGILISYVASIEQEVPVGDVIARFAPVDSDPDQVARAIAAASGEQGGDVAVAPSPAASPSPSTVATPVTGSQGTPAVVFEESKPPTDSLVLAASWFSPVNRPPAGARRGSPAAGQDQQSAGELASKSGFLQAQKSELTVPTGYEDVAYSATEHTRLRRAIAKNLAESWNTAPQLTAQVDVDFSAVSVARAKLNRDRASRGEAKLSYLPFIAVALCKAIAEHPVVNATFTDTHLLQWQTVNLGLAVDTPDGLLVPVIRDAQSLSLTELADAIAKTSAALANGTGRPEDLAGGTITISNSGSVGGSCRPPFSRSRRLPRSESRQSSAHPSPAEAPTAPPSY